MSTAGGGRSRCPVGSDGHSAAPEHQLPGPEAASPARPEALLPTSLAAHLSGVRARARSQFLAVRGAAQSYPHVLARGLCLAACDLTLDCEQGIGAPGQDWTVTAGCQGCLTSHTPVSVPPGGLGVRVSSTHESQCWRWSGIAGAGVTLTLCNQQ